MKEGWAVGWMTKRRSKGGQRRIMRGIVIGWMTKGDLKEVREG